MDKEIQTEELVRKERDGVPRIGELESLSFIPDSAQLLQHVELR